MYSMIKTMGWYGMEDNALIKVQNVPLLCAIPTFNHVFDNLAYYIFRYRGVIIETRTSGREIYYGRVCKFIGIIVIVSGLWTHRLEMGQGDESVGIKDKS